MLAACVVHLPSLNHIMAWKNQQQFIEALENTDKLLRIKTYVNPVLEIAEITDRISKSGNVEKPCCLRTQVSIFQFL